MTDFVVLVDKRSELIAMLLSPHRPKPSHGEIQDQGWVARSGFDDWVFWLCYFGRGLFVDFVVLWIWSLISFLFFMSEI